MWWWWRRKVNRNAVVVLVLFGGKIIKNAVVVVVVVGSWLNVRKTLEPLDSSTRFDLRFFLVFSKNRSPGKLGTVILIELRRFSPLPIAK